MGCVGNLERVLLDLPGVLCRLQSATSNAWLRIYTADFRLSIAGEFTLWMRACT